MKTKKNTVLKMSIVCSLLILTSEASAAIVKYRLPLSSNPGISAWYDHDATAGKFKKYSCSTSGSYDGHEGTDFPTYLGRPIYSGAAGELYYRVNGCLNTKDARCGNGFGNHVRIKHLDGRVTIYAHMKKDSVVGLSSLLCSAKVGEVASSGKSDGNHLHFEMWSDKSKTSTIDPFAGGCSQSTSYWYKLNTSGLPTTSCQPAL